MPEILRRAKYAFRYFNEIFFYMMIPFLQESDEGRDEGVKILRKKIDKNFDDCAVAAIEMALNNGFMFLFAEHGFHDPRFIISEEVKEIMFDLFMKMDKGAFTPDDLHDFFCYADVLASLYGICPLNLFIEIYTRDFPDTKIKKEDEFSKFLKQVATVSDYFSFNGGNRILLFSIIYFQLFISHSNAFLRIIPS